ncbi:tetraspanin-18 isoform X1 [Octopus bimaculoides]|uniref:tetraspanin-18 isoform X1 n=2 Tax=Octopus bimaculoides TaxID=37653 RepID=UPI00071CB587|nr:tetraspanin-18 isoform X1 [Octopus bimaculoides]|eukprot:XP_014785833.1 PREDICTED: tetraspanin-18-like isoform X1 [Octopus bimaculoides]
MRVGPKESSPSKLRNYPLSSSSGGSISSGTTATTATTGTVPVNVYVDDNDDDDDIMSLKKQASTVEENHMDDSKTRIRQTDDQDRCTVCLRNVLHCYNVFILILGCGALAVGIWYLVTEYSAREVSVVVGEEWFEVATYLLIGAGGTIALLAFCGCCGTMREDKCVLGFYSGTLSFMLLFLTVSCGMAFYFRRQVGQIVTKDIVKHMTNTIEQQYGLDTRTNSNNKLVTDAWDSLQRQLQCCGIKGGENSSFSWSVYKLRSEWYRRNPEQSPYVPRSCCKKDSNEKKCTGEIRLRAPPALGPPIGKNDLRNHDLNTEGCLDKIREHLIKRAIILGLVAGSIPILLAVGILVSCCLCFRVRQNSDEDEIDL